MQLEGRIVVTGASGLIGRALAQRTAITALGREPRPGALWWEPDRGVVHDDGEPIAALVHLAGANLAARRWNEAWRRELEDSRVRSMLALVQWLGERRQRPAVLICASGVGYYGDRGDDVCDETSPAGSGFLAQLCSKWEAAAQRAEALQLRVVRARFGVVLSREGGALAQMTPLFRLGLGGPLGSGRQWFPWIHVQDAAAALLFYLEQQSCRGAYNTVAPQAVRQREFASALGAVLHRPALLPAPRFALRAALGPIADEALLASQRAVPARLQAEGFAFRFPELDTALRELFPR